MRLLPARLNFEHSPSSGYSPTKSFGSSVPSLIRDCILEKEVSLIAFRQILVVSFFSNTIMTNLKKLIGNKSLRQNNVQQDYLPEFFRQIFIGNPGYIEEYQPTVKNLLIFPTRKILLNKFTFSDTKIVIPFNFKLYVHTCHANFH